MDFRLFVVIGILLVVIVVLLVKLLLVQKTARAIEKQLAERRITETNTLIDVPHRDKTMCKLAERLNGELREMRKERLLYRSGDLELKTAITNISHDLRTPLTAIGGYLDLLDGIEKSEEAEGYLRVIRNRTEALERLTENFFRYSIVASPEYDCSSEGPIAVNSVLEESILGFYAALRERSITPNISMPESNVVRNVNRESLSRVFSNLINNAIKYSAGDLNIVMTETGEITFSNTAPNITDVDVKRLFDRFYTVESARKSTGLGLSIARVLIERMNGTMSASYDGGVLTITVLLPNGVN